MPWTVLQYEAADRKPIHGTLFITNYGLRLLDDNRSTYELSVSTGRWSLHGVANSTYLRVLACRRCVLAHSMYLGEP